MCTSHDESLKVLLRALTVTVIATLALVPEAGATCNPTVQWTWDAATRSPDFPYPVGTTPLVVQLTDDDGNGRIDSQDVPDVVFLHRDRFLGESVMTAVDGLTGADHFTTGDPKLSGRSLVAGDIDGDGVVELIGIRKDLRQKQLVAFEHTGELKWLSDEAPDGLGNMVIQLSLADLDQDGVPEILAAAFVFDVNGRLKWQGTEAGGGIPRVTNGVEVEASIPGLELLVGRSAYSADGVVIWRNGSLPDGLTAVADFDLDGDPEIVLHSAETGVGAGLPTLYLLDHRGSVLGSPRGYGFGFTTQPLVADLDGDGTPELVTVNDGEQQIEALEWTGSAFAVKWSHPIMDGSGAAACSAFDFHGDGGADIVYHDEERWYIFDGPTGAVLSEIAFPSGTGHEIPTVADIDNDCKTEIVLSGNAGVIAYECQDELTLPARGIWNQYSYHVDNVNDDGTIPRFEQPSWATHNSWMTQSARPFERPRADAGADVTICEGQAVVLDGSRTEPCPSSTEVEYRWKDGGSEVCAWSASPTCDVNPGATSTYTLEVRCRNTAECAVADRAMVAVTVEPDVVPDDAGNTLRAVRPGTLITMSWPDVTDARSYTLHRGTGKGVWPAVPFLAGISTTSVDLPDLPSPPDLYFYRVAGASCSGREGP